MSEERTTKPVHVRDVPEEVVAVLQARANAHGMSLTAYLRNMFVEAANKPSMAEWIESATDRDWGVDREVLDQAFREAREEADAR
ncbi:plasmid stability protein [Saccharothrix tamanrassetensis]|uniref:Plasmid stability protein n=1 Tax=Saccharothrix tamanrassetensis TaxID=1051531 RepID=A0A841CDI1_9PSEU|nr:antitoxin [Saccharothrix tamanrassetensis]MBB5954228.1 plasmid stability protein [Saccharothrix tamanrassetensis]